MKVVVVRKNKKLADAVFKKSEQKVRSVVYQATNYVRTEAVKSIVQNPRRGAEVVRYNPKRTVRTSAEGDPPAQDSGNLANLVSVEVRSDNLSGKVISNADYSKALEYGTSKMAARPFMQPAADKARVLINRKLKSLIG